jgi:hypothetical protein
MIDVPASYDGAVERTAAWDWGGLAEAEAQAKYASMGLARPVDAS